MSAGAPSGDPGIALAWRAATGADLPAMMAIQDEVHTALPEREAVFANKLSLFGQGCGVLLDGRSRVVGYGLSHPWRLDHVPPLNEEIALPAVADCFFVHDVALLPLVRGQGAGRTFVARAAAVAEAYGLPALALVSVYGTAPLWAAYGFAPRTTVALAAKLAAYGPGAVYMIAARSDLRLDRAAG